jgi:hypothetical protein
LVERRVRTLMVELLAQDIKTWRSRSEVPRCGASRLSLLDAMPPFMPAMVYRVSGPDDLRQDPKAPPPRREVRRPAQGGAREWNTVVGPNPLRQPILLKLGSEDHLGRLERRRGASLPAQNLAAEPICPGERIATGAHARPQLPLGVGAPDVVRNPGRRVPGLAEALGLESQGAPSRARSGFRTRWTGRGSSTAPWSRAAPSARSTYTPSCAGLRRSPTSLTASVSPDRRR